MSATDTAKPPRIAAILVVNNGLAWLPTALAAVAEQSYPALALLAVDNGSTDGSAELLRRRIPEDRLITLPGNIGFGRAVAEALKHRVAEAADLVLLLHDDLALAPGAIEVLVAALQADETVGIVGPKLREWAEDPVLQEVGMTIDRFGRAEARLEPGELDQGQRDGQREVLYVSTAGMLLRRAALRDLGGFDTRFPAIRDDLDLCWRAWLAGHRVEVVPDAIAYHAAGTISLARAIGKGRAWEPRYLAERNTLAALLKNYGAPRLAWTLPMVMLLGVVKTVAFLATRRFGEATAVVKAYVWNLLQLPRTLRRRRVIQRRRQRSDAEIMRLFAPGLPRLRSYTEALFNWLAGGSSQALADEVEPTLGPPPPDETGIQAIARTVRQHPTAVTATLLSLAYLVGIIPLLGGGQLSGGQIAPWPDSPAAFLWAYGNPWSGEPAASPFFASPALALLGVLSYLGAGSAWLAQRLLVLGLLPLAWILALRAGRLITSRPAPRALGATLYVLSPAVLASLAHGRFGALAAAALLPAVVLGAANATVTDRPSGSAWRAAALLGLGMAALTAVSPPLGALLWIAYAVLLLALVARRGIGRAAVVRLAIAGAGALALVGPWVFGLIMTGSLDVALAGSLDPEAVAPLSLATALLAAPPVWPGSAGVAYLLAPAAAAAVVLAALLLGLRTRPQAVTWLVWVAVLLGVAAWAVAQARMAWPWPPALLIPVAFAQAGLGVIAARCLVGGLRDHAFGVRQLSVVVVGVVLVAGLGAGVLRLATGPWHGLSRGVELLPAFVTADEAQVGPYRVVLLSGGDDAEVRWELTPGAGPSMTQFQGVSSEELLSFVESGVAAAVGGADLRAGADLGLANVRYVVLTDAEPSQQLRAALSRQPALQPLPSHGGRVFRVRSWLPRAALLPSAQAEALLETGEISLNGEGLRSLRRVRGGLYQGFVTPEETGILVLSEDASPLWQARVAGTRLERIPHPAINAFRIGERDGRAEVRAHAVAHRLVVAGQLLVVLALVSLVLRPPGLTQRRIDRSAARALPSSLAGVTAGFDAGGALGDGVEALPGATPAPEAGPDPDADGEPRPEPRQGPAEADARGEPEPEPQPEPEPDAEPEAAPGPDAAPAPEEIGESDQPEPEVTR